MKKFTFLIPVYNDWENLQILLEKIEKQLKQATNNETANSCDV